MLDGFRQELAMRGSGLALADALGRDVIGEGVMLDGLFGPVPLVYADYVASGRALGLVEQFILREVLPYYANSHTEASACGQRMTRLRAQARAEIAALTGAGEACEVIFTGNGATAGINRLPHLLGVTQARAPVVFVGPYEHHSNILPWRESPAQVVEIPEAEGGGIDLAALEQALCAHAGQSDLMIGAFSAASNVTGIVTDPDPVTRLLRTHGALAVWDYAAAGPYLPIDMGAHGGEPKDAVVVSAHKFPGGPGASGVLILRRTALAAGARARPSWPGGGTVQFVSPWGHRYSDSLAAREEAGTPDVLGDIRAALVFMIKAAVGAEAIAEREAQYAQAAFDRWKGLAGLRILGAQGARRLPIFSFTVTGRDGRAVHQQLFTRLLSDVHGIQARGGCACAGPYAHRLLGIDAAQSRVLDTALGAGQELQKPGWVRLNFSYLMSQETARFIREGVSDLLARTEDLSRYYSVDPATARFAREVAA